MDLAEGALSQAGDPSVEAELCRLLAMPPAARDGAIDQIAHRCPADAAALRRQLQHLQAIGLLDDEPPCAEVSAEQPPDAFAPGAQVGAYRLEERLSGGGAGTVFAATHLASGRPIALKLLHTGRFGRCDLAWRARFRREARAVARMVHPGICPLYDAGEVDGTPYLAMPRIEGTSLADCIERTRAREGGARTTAGVDVHGEPGRNRLDSILLLVEKVAAAVHDAHEHGLVHRDVKPANILVDRRGEPILIDFGLVRGLDADEPRLTATTEIVGTPMYLAPEMVAGLAHETDPALDVYGLGVVLFECLTLDPPFTAASRDALYREILHCSPPDPRRRNRLVAHDLATVVRKAMEKDPARRHHSARALADDLRCVRLGLPIAARRTPLVARAWQWCRRHPVAAALLAALALTQAGVGVQARRAQSAERIATAQAALATTHVSWTRLLASDARLRAAPALADDLVPPWPEVAPRMETWLREHAEPLVALRPVVRRALQDLAAGEATPRTRLLGEELAALAARLALFAQSPEGSLAQVRGRLRWAQTIEERSIHDFAEAWRAARVAIRASGRYGGLDLPPQVDLVPLGPDPVTGLWEFAQLSSGDGGAAASVPRRDGNGRLILDAAMGFVFVLVPGGTFLLGAQSEDASAPNYDREALGNEGPVHAVCLSPFLISKYEATQAQWRRLGGRDRSYWRELTPRRDGHAHSLLQPVEQVTWTEAHEVLRRLGLELPTSAQWEYAARGATSWPRYTGVDVRSLHGFENLSDQTRGDMADDASALPFHNDFVGPSPVGSFRANPFGLHDGYGNVQEWCRDQLALPDDIVWYTSSWSRTGDGLRLAARLDPTQRCLRGGAYGSTPRPLRSSHWAAVSPEASGPFGVRPVRALQGVSQGVTR